MDRTSPGARIAVTPDNRTATRPEGTSDRGDEARDFENAVRERSPELFRFAYWKVKDRALAEDLVQETFARAWRSWSALKDGAAMRAWLYAILRNEIARNFERPRPEQSDELALENAVAEGQSSAAERVEMENLLGALPDAYREPLLLQVLGGFSCAEIADIMSISEGAVTQRVSRARLALRELAAGAPVRKDRDR